MITNTHLLAQVLKIPGNETDMTLEGPIDFVSDPKNGITDGSIGAIINRMVPFIVAFAGIGLLLVIIGGGFTLLTSAGDAKKTEAGKHQITNGVIGFILILVAYWLVQIAGTVLGIENIGEIFK